MTHINLTCSIAFESDFKRDFLHFESNTFDYYLWLISPANWVKVHDFFITSFICFRNLFLLAETSFFIMFFHLNFLFPKCFFISTNRVINQGRSKHRGKIYTTVFTDSPFNNNLLHNFYIPLENLFLFHENKLNFYLILMINVS